MLNKLLKNVEKICQMLNQNKNVKSTCKNGHTERKAQITYVFLKYILIVLIVHNLIQKEDNGFIDIKQYFEKIERLVISRKGNLQISK